LLQFHGSAITSDAGLLAYRELVDTLGLTEGVPISWPTLTGKNGRYWLAGLLRRSVFGRLASYVDVKTLTGYVAMGPCYAWSATARLPGPAASASQMGRFETKWLSRPENLVSLADPPGPWIDNTDLN